MLGRSSAPTDLQQLTRNLSATSSVGAEEESSPLRSNTVRGAQQFWGNLTGFIQQAQTVVADRVASLGDSESGGRRHSHGNLKNLTPAAEKRREVARADASEYFVEYKDLDLSQLSPSY